MRHLLATTAMIAAMSIAAVEAQAQTETTTDTTTDNTTLAAADQTNAVSNAARPAITAPDGYTEGSTVLTTANLQDASVYDASGEDIGSLHGLVFTMGTNAAPGMETSSSTPPDTSTENSGTAATTQMDTVAAGVDTTGSPVTPADSGLAGESQQVDTATISDVIIDVGGFLGMGTHRVAAPIGELVVYHNSDDDFRIYLPWSREQLEALPEFDEDTARPAQ